MVKESGGRGANAVHTGGRPLFNSPGVPCFDFGYQGFMHSSPSSSIKNYLKSRYQFYGTNEPTRPYSRENLWISG